MNHYLGIDIGTFELKGVLVDANGRIVASAAKPHEMIVPQPGWAEHRPREDWWDDLTFITQKLLADSKVAPSSIKAMGCSAIGPCMLPVDAEGEPLMNAVLYGVDGRASKEIDDLTAAIGEDALLDRCGNALTSQAVGPKILWLKRNRPEIYAKTRTIHSSTSYLVERLTGAVVIDHYTASSSAPLYMVDRLEWSDELASDIIELDRLPQARLDHRYRRHGHQAGVGGNRTCRRHAGHRRHHRCGRRGAQRRGARTRRHDADVRLDHFHHHADGRARARSAPLVCALDLRRPARVDVGPRDERHAHALVSRQFRAGPRPAGGDDRARRGGGSFTARAREGWSSSPISPASARRSTIRMPRACSSA